MEFKKSYIYALSLLLVTSMLCFPAYSNPLNLTDEQEVKVAFDLSLAMDAITNKVMKCIDNNGGEMDGCVCQTYESCKFKDEYSDVALKYCNVIVSYPHWRGMLINFKSPLNSMSHSIGMAGIGKQFEVSCK